MSETQAVKKERPLSPHLQVYKPQLTSFTSILHRACGIALSAGLLLIVCWLVAAASGEEAYNALYEFVSGPIGTFMLFGWSAALFYHLCNGIRHFFWDFGLLFKIENAYRAGYAVFAVAALLTFATWYCALSFAPEMSAPYIEETISIVIEEGAAE